MNRTEQSRTYLFSGLLVCGICGANMVITGGTRDNAKYACPLHRYRGVCANKLFIRRDRLEDQLLTALTDKLRQPDVLECIVKRFGEQLEDRLNEIRTSRRIISKAELHDEMKELRVQEANLADAIARHGLSEVLSARLRAVENRIGEINRTLHCPETESTFNLSPDEQREFVLQRADIFVSLLRAEPLIAKRTLRQHITTLILTPRQTADGPVFEVTGDVNLFAGNSDVMLSNPLEGIAPHDTLSQIPLIGIFLNPGVGIAGIASGVR